MISMIGLIGIRKNVDIKIREVLAVSLKRQGVVLDELKELFEEVVVISTCNRTEIYFSTNQQEINMREVFNILDWDYSLLDYTFLSKDKDAVKHLLEVVCGFHSKILGEDQILGQIKDAYELSLEKKAVSSKLLRLFEDAISCGKKFRTESKLYKIPVSASSVAVSKAIELGAKNIMVIGYGTIGSLVVKYILGNNIDNLFIVVREKSKVSDINDERVKVLDFKEYRNIINNMDSVISCTSAPHIIIKDSDIEPQGENIVLIDLALPRDIDEKLINNKRVTLFDIDTIGKLDTYNKHLRNDKMNEYKFLIRDYLDNFMKWLEIRDISCYIKELKKSGNEVIESRVKSFEHKCKEEEDVELAKTLIKSTSDYYINRAIKVLKEEKLKGCEEECMTILKRIFIEK